jgi:hypothetical protein
MSTTKDDLTHYFDATQRLKSENRELRAFLESLFCAECGNKFSEPGHVSALDHECKSHTRAAELLKKG